jgi:hypothetical protein
MLVLNILIFTHECECRTSYHAAQTFNISCNDCQQHARWEFLITEQACRVLVWWVLTLIVDYAVIPFIWTEESLDVDTPVLFSVFSVVFVRAYNFHIKATGLFCSLSVSLTSSFWDCWRNGKRLHLHSISTVLDLGFGCILSKDSRVLQINCLYKVVDMTVKLKRNFSSVAGHTFLYPSFYQILLENFYSFLLSLVNP